MLVVDAEIERNLRKNEPVVGFRRGHYHGWFQLSSDGGHLLDNGIDNAVFHRFFCGHEVVSLGVIADLLEGFACEV